MGQIVTGNYRRDEGRIRAILGPTNTGKTHLAMERMQAYNSGMIGFPLRLLARENYDRLVAAKGAGSVALITGEEKIIPARPKWYICTVESMPVSESVEFVAIDEIQLCEDRDRGHIFTDRLLHARGRQETMFLGSDTMAPLIRHLVEDVEIESRPRLSTLSYGGRQKLTRLPRRTAIVAFSIDEVYAIAETMRQHRGGTAVVLGALSPRTRNAQVAMYQAGEVDYLVATDAIGMGLNMDVDHVAFASLRKFDGHSMRPLRPWELGQIAGRAGRHMNDGTFGVTNNLPDLEDDMVELMEGHKFTPVTHIQWRNPRLDFKSPKLLLRSLQKNSKAPELMRTRDATDHVALQALMKDEEVMLRATTTDRVQTLWDVCQIPDFRKITPDHHAQFLTMIYVSLIDFGHVQENILAERMDRLDNAAGEIDQLTQRLAHIRSWAYVANRSSWLKDSYHWQMRTQTIEEKISDALHQALMVRFVDKRAAMIGRKINVADRDRLSSVSPDGTISIEGHLVGRMAGFRFQPDRAKDDQEAKKLAAAASGAITSYVKEKVRDLDAALDSDIKLTPLGMIAWRSQKGEDFIEIAKLTKGGTLYLPKVQILHHDISDASHLKTILSRLDAWLKGYLAHRLMGLELPDLKLKDEKAKEVQQFSAFARGLAFQLKEGLGSVSAKSASAQVAGLTTFDRKKLTEIGVRFGVHWVFWKRFLHGDLLRLRSMLYAVFSEQKLPALPRKGQIILPIDYMFAEAPSDAWPTIGYVGAGPVALRHDHFEAVMAYLRQENKKRYIEINERLAARISCNISLLTQILRAFGCKEVKTEGGTVYRLKGNEHYRPQDESRASKSPQARKTQKPKKAHKETKNKNTILKAESDTSAEKKMDRTMVASQQVPSLTENIKPPVLEIKTEGPKKNHPKSKKSKYSPKPSKLGPSKINPDSPFAGLKDMLKGKLDG